MVYLNLCDRIYSKVLNIIIIITNSRFSETTTKKDVFDSYFRIARFPWKVCPTFVFTSDSSNGNVNPFRPSFQAIRCSVECQRVGHWIHFRRPAPQGLFLGGEDVFWAWFLRVADVIFTCHFLVWCASEISSILFEGERYGNSVIWSGIGRGDVQAAFLLYIYFLERL